MHKKTRKAGALAVLLALVLAGSPLMANPEDAANRSSPVNAVNPTQSYDFELTIVHGVEGAREQTIIRRKMQYADYVAEYGPFTPNPIRDFDPIEQVVPTPDPPVGGSGFEDGDTLTMTRTGHDGEFHYTRVTQYLRRAGDWRRMSNIVTSRMCSPQLCLMIHKP
ncbi:MAG: hypothetical protein AB7V26_06160 [Lysobacterales bacterium]